MATGVGCTAPSFVVPPAVVEVLPDFPVETPVTVARLNAPSPGVL